MFYLVTNTSFQDLMFSHWCP